MSRAADPLFHKTSSNSVRMQGKRAIAELEVQAEEGASLRVGTCYDAVGLGEKPPLQGAQTLLASSSPSCGSGRRAAPSPRLVPPPSRGSPASEPGAEPCVCRGPGGAGTRSSPFSVGCACAETRAPLQGW